MGDRTRVTLSIPLKMSERAEKIFEYKPSDQYDNDTTVDYYFDEVNYGNISFLKDLVAAGIAFDSAWDHGGEYNAGCTYGRFTAEGEYVEKEIYEDGYNPPMDTLLIFIDKPQMLREFILEHKAKTTVLSWENQEEYGKIYRARNLIAPA